ncbi:MAG TPA: PAS domain-containing protein, partial [Allocoleopsis sp.]
MNLLLNKLLAPRQMEYVCVDQDLKITEISWGVHRFADLPEALTIGKDVRISFPELIGLEEQLIAIFNGKQLSYELKTVYRHPEKPLYFDIYIVADQDYKSKKTTLIIVFEDVTEKMIIQQELVQRTNEAALLLHNLMTAKSYTDKIISAMADALIVTDHTGKIKTVNPAAQNLLGYSESELLNQPLWLILSLDKIFLPLCQIPKLSDSLFRDMEIICQHKNGEQIYASFSCSFGDNELEEMGDFVYIGRNITERKQVEKKQDEQLLEEQKARKESEISQQKFRFLVESIPQQVWMAKPDGNYNYVNYHLRVYYGCTANEILGKGWQKNIHPDDLPWVLKQWEKCLKTGEKYEMELRIKQGNADIYRWHLTRALPMRDR